MWCQKRTQHKHNIKAFNDTQLEMFNVDPPHPWIETNCYQLANRLAFLYFCNKNLAFLYFCNKKCDINAKLFYFGFINGFRIKAGNEYVGAEGEVHSEKDWMEVWNKEYKELGLDWKDVSPYIVFIYPDFDPNRKK